VSGDDSIALGPGREFDLVREMLGRWGSVARGIGDDAAIVDVPAGERLVVSTDTSIEDVHFRRTWLSPEEIGYRAAAAALSDLAAMAASPIGLTVALSLSPSWIDDVTRIADGVARAASAAGAAIIGGDITRSHELVLGITVLGSAARPIGRDGARAGDVVYVTGTLGGPGEAVRAWIAGESPSARARERFACPMPRIREARWLADHGATAMIDLSDGLLGDASHVAHASGARLALALHDVPTIDGVSAEDAARSGEEYELLVTAPSLDVEAFAREFGIPLTAIGGVERGTPEVVATIDGRRVARSGGFDHLS
jgi:thiamine-monophosphate kinase